MQFQVSPEMALKLKLVDYLLLKKADAIGLELALAHGRFRVDAYYFTSGLCIGVEIKSKHDDISKLPSQLSVYRSYFDKVEVLCEPDNLPKVKQKVGRRDGLLSGSSTSVCQVKDAQVNAKFRKDYLLSTLSTAELHSVFGHEKGMTKFDLVTKVKGLVSVQEALSISRSALFKRAEVPTKRLYKECSNSVHPDDLMLLANVNKLI